MFHLFVCSPKKNHDPLQVFFLRVLIEYKADQLTLHTTTRKIEEKNPGEEDTEQPGFDPQTECRGALRAARWPLEPEIALGPL
jgi:hypothetical protein